MKHKQTIKLSDKLVIAEVGLEESEEFTVKVKPGEWQIFEVGDCGSIFMVHSANAKVLTPDKCIKHYHGETIDLECGVVVIRDAEKYVRPTYEQALNSANDEHGFVMREGDDGVVYFHDAEDDVRDAIFIECDY